MGITMIGGQTHWFLRGLWIIVNAARDTHLQRVYWDVIGLCFVMADEVI